MKETTDYKLSHKYHLIINFYQFINSKIIKRSNKYIEELNI